VKEGRITKKDADLLNYHIAISHSNLEDLLLLQQLRIDFLDVDTKAFIAIIVVWGRKFFVNRE
jgi:hypothetical protein